MNGSVVGIPTLFKISEKLQCMLFWIGNATIFFRYFTKRIFEHSCTTCAFRFRKELEGAIISKFDVYIKRQFKVCFVIVLKDIMSSILYILYVEFSWEISPNCAKKKLLKLIATFCVGGIVSIPTFLKTGKLQFYSKLEQ